MKKYILGNWKMHGLQKEASALAGAIAAQTLPNGVEVVLFPPFTALPVVAQAMKGNAIKLGAQDCSPEEKGAFTGDISAMMLRDAGCTYVILGHSERRALHGETDEAVKGKAEAAIKAGLIPVICVGEDIIMRESGNYLAHIESQLTGSLPSSAASHPFIIAYEPVWAIGSGKTPTAAQISEVHKTIESRLSYATSGAQRAIVYGGSVKASNAGAILAVEKVDGVLVGGASLDAAEFGTIIRAGAKDKGQG